MTGANRADFGRTWLPRRWMPWRYHGVTIIELLRAMPEG